MSVEPSLPIKRSCFVVSPIGNAGSAERKHADQVFNHIIEPVLDRLGYDTPERADRLSEPGIITRQIVGKLLTVDLVIADLSGRNPNVFYELAIRHAVRKPLVQMITRGEEIPFDVGQQRTIFFDRTDLDDVEACKKALAVQVLRTHADDFQVESPIEQALVFDRLKNSGDETQQVLAKLISQVDELTRLVRSKERVATGARNDAGFSEVASTLLKGVLRATLKSMGKTANDSEEAALTRHLWEAIVSTRTNPRDVQAVAPLARDVCELWDALGWAFSASEVR